MNRALEISSAFQTEILLTAAFTADDLPAAPERRRVRRMMEPGPQHLLFIIYSIKVYCFGDGYDEMKTNMKKSVVSI